MSARVFIDTRVVEAVGLLDPGLRHICSDADYCYRARLAGLDSDRAERACELLKAKSMDCKTVPPEGFVRATN